MTEVQVVVTKPVDPPEMTREEKMTHFQRLSPDRKLTVLYAELIDFRAFVADFESKAAAMSNPDNLMAMAQSFLGKGFGL